MGGARLGKEDALIDQVVELQSDQQRRIRGTVMVAIFAASCGGGRRGEGGGGSG